MFEGKQINHSEGEVPEYNLDTLAEEVELLREMNNLNPEKALGTMARGHFPADIEKQEKVKDEVSVRLLERKLKRIKSPEEQRQKKIDDRHNKVLRSYGG